MAFFDELKRIMEGNEFLMIVLVEKTMTQKPAHPEFLVTWMPKNSIEAFGARQIHRWIIRSFCSCALLLFSDNGVAQTVELTKSPVKTADPTSMKIVIIVNGVRLSARLFDNPSARDFFAQLPLTLDVEDYVGKEKIAYLPRKLTSKDSGPFTGEAIGDIAYYAPWGNLALFYGTYRYSSGLIRLGRIEDDLKPLLLNQNYSITIEPVPTDIEGNQ